MANELATIDKLSGGRFTAGLVAGYLHEEYDTLGHDRATRGQLADEYLDAMVTLWTNEVATYHGNYIHFDEVTLAARPAGPPELWSHGGNVRALRRAIRWCDGWGPIVGPGVADRPEGASDEFAIGKAEAGDVADPYAELVASLNQEHPGIHVPESKTYEWMQGQLDRHREQIEARDRPLALSLGVSLDASSVDSAPERIQEQLDRGATKINLGINSESLDGFLDVVRRFGEQVLPSYRD
jgi:alkanesulfonate monooxygenase SsuD/methylene tetrahydromethanopterin reductase-like flavin-dependent oxidoreductase (luciferase family)